MLQSIYCGLGIADVLSEDLACRSINNYSDCSASLHRALTVAVVGLSDLCTHLRLCGGLFELCDPTISVLQSG